jgi:two-component system chemotaxis response regulator CheY
MPIDRSMPVLIVEPHETIVVLVERMLRQLGYEKVQRASDSTSAWEMLREAAQTLVIADLHLQPSSGLQLLRMIRADQKLRRCPFLIMAESLTADDALAVKQAGVDGLMLKPFKPDALEPKLEAALKNIGRPRVADIGPARKAHLALGRRLQYRH